MTDLRATVAQYYDLQEFYNDVPFYLARLPGANARVLELGCGTGRVSVPLARASAFLHGVDHSDAMVRICCEKLEAAGLAETRARVTVGDICDLELGTRFDYIIAPFRVMQNLETDQQVHGLFSTIRRHLSPGGRCILNTFRPNRSRDEIVKSWSTPELTETWTRPIEGGHVVHQDHRTRCSVDPLVLYPMHVYQRFEGERLVEEVKFSFAMRCYYPDELLELVRAAGFRITATFGGYEGEEYGVGPEQVVEFA